jgi:hypothetical protein
MRPCRDLDFRAFAPRVGKTWRHTGCSADENWVANYYEARSPCKMQSSKTNPGASASRVQDGGRLSKVLTS